MLSVGCCLKLCKLHKGLLREMKKPNHLKTNFHNCMKQVQVKTLINGTTPHARVKVLQPMMKFTMNKSFDLGQVK
jgi:hypothetical protein